MAQSLPAQQQVEKLTATCSVCRGPAAPHLHYGAVCCYSCRAFFRRGVARDYECVAGTDSCVIDTVTRRNCQKCRFNRCLYAGMRPDWVDATLKKKYYSNHKTHSKSPTSEALTQDQVYWEPPQFQPQGYQSYPFHQDRIPGHQSKKDGHEMMELTVPVHQQHYKEMIQAPNNLEQVLDIVNTEEFNFGKEERIGGRKRSISQSSPDEAMDEDLESMHAKKIFLEPRHMIESNFCQDYEGFELYDDPMYTSSVNSADVGLAKGKGVGNALTFFGEFQFLEENNVFDNSSEYPESTNSSCSSTATTPRIMFEDMSPFVNIEALVDECFAQEFEEQRVGRDEEKGETEPRKVMKENSECYVLDMCSNCNLHTSALLKISASTYRYSKQLVYLSTELNDFFKCYDNVKENFWINFSGILQKYKTPSFNRSVQQFVNRHFQICKTPNKQVKQMLKKVITFEKLARKYLQESNWSMILVFLFFNLPRFTVFATYSRKLDKKSIESVQ